MSKPLLDRLKKNHVAWTDEHTKTIRLIKNSIKSIPCLFFANPALPKIVEIDASDLGYGRILKQKEHDKEQIIQYVSAHCNECQKNYFTIKKEILSIVLCISKFQSDLLNQKFLLRIDCKAAKHV